MYRKRANYLKPHSNYGNSQYGQYEECQQDYKNCNYQQYECNNLQNPSHGYEANREQSRNILKQITDKYGFYWDEKGKLLKNRHEKSLSNLNLIPRTSQDKTKNNKLINLNLMEMKNKNQNTLKIRQKSLSKNKQNCYAYQKKQKQNKIIFQQHLLIKSEIENIDEKINSIVSKYKKNTYQNNRKQQEQYHNIRKRTRTIVEEDIPKQSPHFGNNHIVHNYITRSKSTNMLPNLQKNYQKYTQQNFTQSKKNKIDYNPYNYQNMIEKRQKSQQIIPKQNTQLIQKKYLQYPKKSQINEKIDNITRKIKQCEKQKQKLQIQFKRFDVCQKSTTPQQSKIRNKTVNNEDFYLNIQNLKEIQPNKNQIYYKNILKDQNFILNTPKQNKVKKFQQKQDLQNFIPRKSLQKVPSQKLKIQKSSIITKFCHQIELDEQFRNAKLWFENNEDPHKWGILADKLAMNGKQYKYHDLVSKFSCTLEEHNPFFSVKNSHESYASLLSTFIENERHWYEQIENKFQMEDLTNLQFNTRQFDIEQKGYVKVEDFVRYINMRTKNFYRSRDLLLLFQRFAGKDKKQVHFSRVLEVLLVEHQDY